MIKLFHGINGIKLDITTEIEYNGTINIEFIRNILITL